MDQTDEKTSPDKKQRQIQSQNDKDEDNGRDNKDNGRDNKDNNKDNDTYITGLVNLRENFEKINE